MLTWSRTSILVASRTNCTWCVTKIQILSFRYCFIDLNQIDPQSRIFSAKRMISAFTSGRDVSLLWRLRRRVDHLIDRCPHLDIVLGPNSHVLFDPSNCKLEIMQLKIDCLLQITSHLDHQLLCSQHSVVEENPNEIVKHSSQIGEATVSDAYDIQSSSTNHTLKEVFVVFFAE